MWQAAFGLGVHFAWPKFPRLLAGCRVLRLTLAPAEVNRRRFSDSRGIKMEPAVRLILVTSPSAVGRRALGSWAVPFVVSDHVPGEGRVEQNLIPCHRKVDGSRGEVGLAT